MKYFVDIIIAILLLALVLFFVYKPLPSFSISSLSLRGIDGYSINPNKEFLILHFSDIDCMACKRDTQVLMRFHVGHPDIPIIDANIVYKETDKEKLITWKQKIDLQYTVAIIENPKTVFYPIPTTLVIDNKKTTKIFGVLTYEKLLDAAKRNQ
jgi:thioredoxin-related protein